MSAQKWVSPAGTPLTATVTGTGPSGQATYAKSYGAAGDLNVGTAIELVASGTLTTTGAPTVTLNASGFGGDGVGEIVTCSSDVTARPWNLTAVYTIRAINADDSMDYAYWYRLSGVADSDIVATGTTNAATWGASLGISFSWDTADSGDVLTMGQAFGKWIG